MTDHANARRVPKATALARHLHHLHVPATRARKMPPAWWVAKAHEAGLHSPSPTTITMTCTLLATLETTDPLPDPFEGLT